MKCVHSLLEPLNFWDGAGSAFAQNARHQVATARKVLRFFKLPRLSERLRFLAFVTQILNCKDDVVRSIRSRSSCRFIFLRKIDPHVLVRGELLEGRIHDGAEMEAAELAGKRSQ